MKRVPTDENLNKLFDRGSELYTTRFTGVDSSTGLDLALDYDFKEIWIHKEGSSPIFSITGTLDGSVAATWTSDGYTLVLPICKEADDPLGNWKAPSGTMTLSVFAWR